MKALSDPLEQLEVFEKLQESLNRKKGLWQAAGCIDSQKTHFIQALGRKFTNHLIITYSEQKAKEIFEEYKVFRENVYLYPAKDFLFFRADIKGKMLEEDRMKAVRAIAEEEPAVVITTIDGCMGKISPLSVLSSNSLHIGLDSIIELEALKNKLVWLGYERVTQVDCQGQFAIRGGIIDVFPPSSEDPIRIELWGEEVDSIRCFDVESQRSIENLENVVVYPAKEVVSDGKNTEMVSLISYFSRDDSVIFLDEPNRLVEKGDAVEAEFRENFENQNLITKDIFSVKEIMLKSEQCHGIVLTMMESGCGELKVSGKYSFETKAVNSYNNSFPLLVKDLKNWKKEKYKVVLMCASVARAKRLAEEFMREDLNAFYSQDDNRIVSPGEIMLIFGNIRHGYEYPMLKFAVLSETDIFGKEKRKNKKRKKYEGQHIQNFAELSIGDYVVHEDHGLGIYRGIEKIEIEKTYKDYIKIEYAAGGNLYILATQLESLQKYGSAQAKRPKLNRLGGTEWNRTRTKVHHAVAEVARDLVELYAARRAKEGYVFGKDTIWQTEFEEMFPFEETEDQIQAIEAVKEDMESPKIMERLICGDVGYGKTEIAIRAAFKAAQESKQVVFLVPTTILAQQHYNTFIQRMKEFPVRVDLLCRFQTAAQQKKTIEDLKKGLVDIVIGTHRVISKDVAFKDLGLLIIDEEQRFGVTHKEKIKKLKENVDVLTLTATPIPRTLHMSLAGIRDMSILEEAPNDRLPIQTYVMEYEDKMVRAAINRELARGGQIFFVYNKVATIADMTAHLMELIPEASISYAHGQMKEQELERVMYDYVTGEIDVLVATTIIETGLDISNANTMIVYDADNMGLSQLYQLRGRIGRSNRLAYAFLMYRKGKNLTEVSEKRLHAIREFTELGSGFKIAMRDLEIRGAGNLLGAQQHGHMQAVGYDLYCKMLNEAVKDIQGKSTIMDHYDTVIDLQIDAFLPDSYIKNEGLKFEIYKQIAAIEKPEECEDIQDELMDRFGELPQAALNLLEIARLKAIAHSLFITEITGNENQITLVLYEKAQMNPNMIPGFVENYKGALTFKMSGAPRFIYQFNKSRGQMKTKDVVKVVTFLLEDMKKLVDTNSI